MKALNDLHCALMSRKEARTLYRATRHLEPWLARDIGLHLDHTARLAHRF
ncbi:hypothetical protein OEW28_07390 [Defluviimonas sp. WL0002]|uniref:Uncharacterized protein n=1 Tax=Albidovulum marisflavi TaxID=2984159 RepID=A0ABT2ZBL8_9RHOB|nr:hypothetical protein [Defluviimonas sp. WL0002]MCV2868450.1 hypothetical protein [Defluviimonas sp. WL0002]